MPTVPLELEKLIDSIDGKKSYGPMSLPVHLLKLYKEFFSFWLSKLVNMSFDSGVFPDIFKIARVTPIHKKESKLNYLNYRPISLLSVFSKIYKKLIYTRVYEFLTKYNLISSKQFGFRKSYSTTHAIISITERIKYLLDKGQFVCGIFIDLEKAFDTVNHDILCDKLNYYGLRGNVINLFKSYLSDRKQYVTINGVQSETKNVTCGVPQGSSLGPLLFLIYINDFSFCLNQTETGHFADDTYLLYSSQKLKTIETIINTELKLVSKWLRLNKLSLNSAKTEFILFRSPRRPVDFNMVIKLDGKKLKPVKFVKYLGIFIDEHLSWNTHVQHLCKKLSRATGILSKLRYNAPLKTCLSVYFALFYQPIIYGCNAWSLTSEANLDKIEKIQNKVVRIITFSDFNSPSNNLFIRLKIVKFRDILKMQHLKLAFEHSLNAIPTELRKLFTFCSYEHVANMAFKSVRKKCLEIPRIKSVLFGDKSVRNHCATLWKYFVTKVIKLDEINNLDMTRIHNVHQLKRKLKKHFLFTYTLA